MAQGVSSGFVDLVVADAVAGVVGGAGGGGFGCCSMGLPWGVAVTGPVRSVFVVVVPELIELGLQVGQWLLVVVRRASVSGLGGSARFSLG